MKKQKLIKIEQSSILQIEAIIPTEMAEEPIVKVASV